MPPQWACPEWHVRDKRVGPEVCAGIQARACRGGCGGHDGTAAWRILRSEVKANIFLVLRCKIEYTTYM